jgi:hypothetical protein
MSSAAPPRKFLAVVPDIMILRTFWNSPDITRFVKMLYGSLASPSFLIVSEMNRMVTFLLAELAAQQILIRPFFIRKYFESGPESPYDLSIGLRGMIVLITS